MIRLGLCCLFRDEPIRFRCTTVTAISRMAKDEASRKLVDLCRANAEALRLAICACAASGIGSFRVNSQILPVKTHPLTAYNVETLHGGASVIESFRRCGQLAQKMGVRLSFHPDQFVLLSSPDKDVMRRSVQELEYQAEVACWIGADVVNIHGGGAYGNKQAALERVQAAIEDLKPAVRKRLTLENDDRVYTPADLLPVCRATGIPLVYDVHHHRCLPDGLSVEEATEAAIATWTREPMFHLSSPRNGWRASNPRLHHDFINLRDFPRCWLARDLTVDIEAKAKEAAVRRVLTWLRSHGIDTCP